MKCDCCDKKLKRSIAIGVIFHSLSFCDSDCHETFAYANGDFYLQFRAKSDELEKKASNLDEMIKIFRNKKGAKGKKE